MSYANVSALIARASQALRPPPREPGSCHAAAYVCDVIEPAESSILLSWLTNDARILCGAWITERAMWDACGHLGFRWARNEADQVVIFCRPRDPRHTGLRPNAPPPPRSSWGIIK